jgi:hypothetical protein
VQTLALVFSCTLILHLILLFYNKPKYSRPDNIYQTSATQNLATVSPYETRGDDSTPTFVTTWIAPPELQNSSCSNGENILS